ncbi:MAG: hypothetical protein L6R40_002446 [Gallowayella cf. fulva]|nr:MAG: hypothetical protein L6R40_002446 [Xanthomendoza cf. fulva]
MEVFDAVTQNPIFSSAIKHVIYDSAQFVDYCIEDYFNALFNQLKDDEYKRIRISNDAVRELMDMIHPHQKGYMSRIQGFKQFQEHAGFMEGFRQHSLLARGQDTNIDRPWFARVCEGLRKLGPVHSVFIRNTWDMIYDDDDDDDDIGNHCSANESDTDKETHDGHQSKGNDLENNHDDWEDCGSSDASSIDRLLESAPGLRSDGTRLVGSPLARAWPPERLQPPFQEHHLSDREKVCGVPWDEWYSVYQEFILVAQMLKSADKHPVFLRIPGNDDSSESLSPCVLTVDKSPNNPFLHLSSQLKTLQLSIAPLEYGTTIRLAPRLSLLMDFFRTTKSLTSLNLKLPVENADSDSEDEERSEDEGYSLYNFTNIFPPLPQLQLTNLNFLCLAGLEISYRNLAALLFLKLPNLKSLAFWHIQLVKGGYWEDIIEGLRHIRHLKSCILSNPLLYSNFHMYPSQLHRSPEGFLHANGRYVELGGRHPALKKHETDSASLKYLERLNETLDQVRKAIGT